MRMLTKERSFKHFSPDVQRLINTMELANKINIHPPDTVAGLAMDFAE